MKIALSLLITGSAAQDLFLATKHSASQNDLVRASTRIQAGRLAGSNPQEIADKLNGHIQKSGMQTKSCDSHTLEELNNLMRSMWPQFSAELDQVYQTSEDLRSKRFATLREYEQSWAAEVESNAETLRHAKCHEVVMMWAHHMSEAAKKVWQGNHLPTLPVYDAKKANNKVYAQSTSCQTGHAMVTGSSASTHKWPDWPEELHYKAKAHGAYPFWWGGGSDSGTADMEVWWSEKQGAEKFSHSSCTGQSSWLNGPCVHLMIAPGATNLTLKAASAPQAYLYKTDESKCCISEPSSSLKFPPGPGGSETLAPSQGTFWNTFTYKGEKSFSGVNYKGQAKYYVLSGVNEPVTDFWYFTDLEGKPVQQGEGGTGPTDQGYPTSIGHTIWHDYDQSSFDTSAIAPSVFAVPAACKTTTTRCEFP